LRRCIAAWPGWSINGHAGRGSEIDRIDHKLTTTVDVRVNRPSDTGWRHGLHTPYLNSAGDVKGIGYWSSLFGATLTVPLH
jgi:hypothetical protein